MNGYVNNTEKESLGNSNFRADAMVAEEHYEGKAIE